MMEELFPEATATEIKLTKAYLKKYREKKKKTELFECGLPQTEKQKKVYEALRKFTTSIELAVDQILDDNVKAVIEYRFIKGNTRAATILKFSGWNYCDKTIDRKIEDGIVAIANTLIYLE